jgi:ElaB protein
MADFESQKKELMKEVRSVLDEVEDLYENASNDGSDMGKELKARVHERLNKTKSKMSELEDTLVEKARATAERTDEMVREQPYYAMGIAAAVGFVAGILIGRCRS